MSFTRMSARGSDVLLIDGSRIDTAGLHRGSKDAIDRFISFLKEAGEAVDCPVRFYAPSRVHARCWRGLDF